MRRCGAVPEQGGKEEEEEEEEKGRRGEENEAGGCDGASVAVVPWTCELAQDGCVSIVSQSSSSEE
jgi:hypothetical protein|eukprot:COSAG01_NODE_13_length_41723_cov_145.394556_39_plen_66_part_00